MKQIQILVILLIVCSISIIASFTVWTEVMTEYFIMSYGNKLNASLIIDYDKNSVYVAEYVEQVINEIEPIHKSASEAPIVPTSKEPDQSETTSIIDRIFLNQEEKELEQWGISEWLTISIPSISVRAPVYLPSGKYWEAREWGLLEEQMQVGLLSGAAAYPHSEKPGQNGTIYIAGHSSPPNDRARKSAYGTLFARLQELDHGDKITVVSEGKLINYKVIRSQIVSATDTQILAQQSDKSLLRLITCYPVGTTQQRMIVTAEAVPQ